MSEEVKEKVVADLKRNICELVKQYDKQGICVDRIMIEREEDSPVRVKLVYTEKELLWQMLTE